MILTPLITAIQLNYINLFLSIIVCQILLRAVIELVGDLLIILYPESTLYAPGGGNFDF